MAGEGYDQISVIADQQNKAHTAWNGMINVGGRYYSKQIDLENFSNPYAIVSPGIAGTSGYPQLGMDSNGILHFITTLDIYGGIHYAYTFQGNWTETVNISGNFDLEKYKDKSIEQPRMVISQGNKINVVYEVGFKEIYYQSLKLNAPSVFQTPVPKPSSINTKDSNSETNLNSQEIQPTSPPILSTTDLIPDTIQSNPAAPIFLSLIPVLTILILVIIWKLRKHSR